MHAIRMYVRTCQGTRMHASMENLRGIKNIYVYKPYIIVNEKILDIHRNILIIYLFSDTNINIISKDILVTINLNTTLDDFIKNNPSREIIKNRFKFTLE
ncbi:hypothetical protein ACJX0J_032829 [Zea mays]